MARVKWNAIVNSKDTNLNDVSKVPPNNLRNTMPNGGKMQNPFNDQLARQLNSVFNSLPAHGDRNSTQPGRSSREGTFNLHAFPDTIGNLRVGWPQSRSTTGSVDHDGKNQSGIQSNLTDIPSIHGRKWTGQK